MHARSGLLALALLIGGCRSVSPQLPVSGDEELCCKTASSDNVSFVGCRVAQLCRTAEPVWVRGPLACGEVDAKKCEGGRCCELLVPAEPQAEPPPEPPPEPERAEILADPLQVRELPRAVVVPKVLCPGTIERGIEGVVVLQVNIDVDGRVTQVEVRSSLDVECDAVAREALRSAVFKPARDLGGEPVAFALRYEYAFVVADTEPAPAPASGAASPSKAEPEGSGQGEQP